MSCTTSTLSPRRSADVSLIESGKGWQLMVQGVVPVGVSEEEMAEAVRNGVSYSSALAKFIRKDAIAFGEVQTAGGIKLVTDQ